MADSPLPEQIASHFEDDIYIPDPTDLLWSPPCCLPLKYWKRSEETQNAKEDHLDHLETLPYSREELILSTTLSDGREAAIEKNLFPYDCPSPIEHWTLWSRKEMSHRQICTFMENWAPTSDRTVIEWNYEENSHRSFDIPHVHVFIRFEEESAIEVGLSPLSSKRPFSCVAKEQEEVVVADASVMKTPKVEGFDSPSQQVSLPNINPLPSSCGSLSDEGNTDSEDCYSNERSRKKKCSSRVKCTSGSEGSSESEEGQSDREDFSDDCAAPPKQFVHSTKTSHISNEFLKDSNILQ